MEKKMGCRLYITFGCKRCSLQGDNMGPSPDDRDRLNIIDTAVL
jgi:hypothetical protein